MDFVQEMEIIGYKCRNQPGCILGKIEYRCHKSLSIGRVKLPVPSI